ncbi:MAG: RecX family transcriptional regulator [Candidatus Absconditicoccaceae bacterium]
MATTCLNFSLNYISRYPKTEKELTVHLFQKGFMSSDVNETIKKLKELGYINDEHFVQSYINSEISNKGKPVIVIKQKLIQKGVDVDLVDQLLKRNIEDMQEGTYKKITRDIQNYKKKGIDGFDIIQKLMRKGYKLDDIKSVIHNRNN